MANYFLNDDKMFADITDGIAIIINSETGIYYGMNELGTAVYENLMNGASSEDVLVALKAMPNAPTDIENRLNVFIEAVLENELLTLSDTTSSSAVSLVVENTEEFTISVTEYNDAQELLLADPIHEVKEDTGWSPEKSALNPDADDVARREDKVKK